MNAQYASGPEEQARAAATIAAAVDAEISSGLFPGAVVLIGSKDAVLYHEAFGLARIDPDPVPMRKDSLFDIASMTKVVATATAIGILVDRGRIDPSAPMTRYLPDHQGRGASRISLRSLAAHTSGFTRSPSDRVTGDAFFAHLLTINPQRRPDAAYQYACLNSMYLAMIVERVSGKGFGAFCQENIFNPLEMHDTVFNEVEVCDRVVATYYDRVGVNHNRFGRNAGRAIGNAGLFSTASDLANFSQMMLAQGDWNDRRILSPEVIADFTVAYKPEDFGVRGFQWHVQLDANHRPQRMGDRAYGHGGSTGTSFWIDPDAGVFAIVLTNRDVPERPPRNSDRHEQQYRSRARIADAALEALGY